MRSGRLAIKLSERRRHRARARRLAIVAIAPLVSGCSRPPQPKPIYEERRCPELVVARSSVVPPELLVQPRKLTTDQPDGFFVLGAVQMSSKKPAPEMEAQVVEESGALCQLLRTLNWGPPAEDIDFSRYIVFAFFTDEWSCYAPAEPEYLELTADGTLHASLAMPYRQCLATDSIQGSMRLLAIARTGLPAWGFRFALRDHSIREFRLRHPLGRLPAPLPKEEPLMRPISGHVRARMPLPPAGEPRLGRLDDGTFVWVVHHGNNLVSVLDARSTYGFVKDLPGIPHLVRWEKLTRRFQISYDEFGVSRRWPSLPRYETEVDPIANVVRIGEKGPPLERKLMAPIGAESGPGPDYATTVEALPWLSLDQSLRAPDGSVVLIDASFVVAPDHPPYLCPGATRSLAACLSSDWMPGLAYVRADSMFSHGPPTVARVRKGRFYEVTLTFGISSSSK